MDELYIKYEPQKISPYLKDYYIQFVYCGMVLLRRRSNH